ncbi:MAG: hypothetical protein RLZZ346_735 [Cyanobacteriota bacterium]
MVVLAAVLPALGLGLVLVPADRAATAAGLGGLWVLLLLLLLRWSLPRP